MYNFPREYHAAMAKLAKAEKRHRDALDALDAALAEKRAHDVPGLRKAAAATEAEIKIALEAATLAHRTYWRSRRIELEPRLREAGALMHRYDRLARVEGIRLTSPALARIQAFYADAGPQPDIVDDDAVPIDPPDSELLGNYMGSWRHG